MQRWLMHGRSGNGPVAGSAVALTAALLLAACGGGAATPTPAPATAPPATQAPTAAPSTAATATNPATGPAAITAPATVGAGTQFEVAWTGPNGEGDYITIVSPSATKWTNEPYFYTSAGSPGRLTAPAAPGSYALWYVSGADDAILVRVAIEITAFVGSVDGPDSVPAGTEFEVSWTGPDGPGDYVTIVKVGAAKWTNEPYFYTTTGSPGTLQAPIDAGAYELWYVLGAADQVAARAPITVTPFSASVTAPASAARGSTFDVTWTGPDGPGDFITIVPAGAAETAYLGYCYTNAGRTCKLTAPDDGGAYEVRYVTQAYKVLASRPIDIK